MRLPRIDTDPSYKTREISNFLKKGKMVIMVKSKIFLDLG